MKESKLKYCIGCEQYVEVKKGKDSIVCCCCGFEIDYYAIGDTDDLSKV